jgi:hypothetical protein
MMLLVHGRLPSFAPIDLCSCIDIWRKIYTVPHFPLFLPFRTQADSVCDRTRNREVTASKWFALHHVLFVRVGNHSPLPWPMSWLTPCLKLVIMQFCILRSCSCVLFSLSGVPMAGILDEYFIICMYLPRRGNGPLVQISPTLSVFHTDVHKYNTSQKNR